MSLRTLFCFLKITGAVLVLITSFWIASLDLKPSHLILNTHAETQGEQTVTQGEQKLTVFFLQDRKSVALAFRQTTKREIAKNYYFLMPTKLMLDGAYIDLGMPSTTWTINSIGFYANFFDFGIHAYQWKPSDIAELAQSYLTSTRLQTIDGLKVTTLEKPGRFYFPLDNSKLESTPELILVKVFSILCIIGIYGLFFSRYFWRLFTTRLVDVEVHEQTYKDLWQTRKVWIVLGSASLLITLVSICYPYLTHMGVNLEDTMELSDAMVGGENPLDPKTYEYYRGYYGFLTQSLSNALSIFPLDWQPRLYTIFGILMLFLALVAVAYSGLFNTRFILLVAPFTLFQGGFSFTPTLHLSLTGTLFSSTALLMAIAVRPSPLRYFTLFPYLVLIAILAWSGPYASQLLPLAFALLLLISSGKKSFILIAIMMLAVAYTLSSSAGMVQFANILNPDIRVAFFKDFLCHVFLFNAYHKPDYKIGLLIVSAIVVMLVAFRGDRIYVKHSLIFLAVSLFSLATFFISYKYGQYAGASLPSHRTIPQFCWIIFILLSADKLLCSVNKTAAQFLVSLIFSGFLVWVTLVARDHATLPNNGLKVEPELPDFLAAVEHVESIELERDEFIQLWHVNQSNWITSYLAGSNDPDAKSVDAAKLPAEFLHYFLPMNLDRSKNMVLVFDKIQNTVNYSDGTTKDLPIKFSRPGSIDSITP